MIYSKNLMILQTRIWRQNSRSSLSTSRAHAARRTPHDVITMETMKEITVNINGMGGMVLFQAADGLLAGHDVVVTSGEDGVVYLTDLSAERVVSETVMCDGAVPSCAVTPEQTHLLVVQDEENALYSYALPSTSGGGTPQLDKLLFRSTVAIRHVVCSSKYIAVADEEAKVKVLLRAAPDQVIVAGGHAHGIKSVAIDPTEQFVCSASEDGTTRVFELQPEQMAAVERAMFKVQYKDIKDDEVLCRCAWQRGEKSTLLAVPVNQGVIELFDRSTGWKSAGQLLLPIGKSVLSDINIVAFSPNGMYVAAATLAKQVFIWSVITKEVVRSFKLDYAVLAVEWALSQNALVAYHAGGKFGFVKDVIPMGRTPPQVFGIAAATASSTATTAALSAGNNAKSASSQPTKKRKKSSFVDDEAGEDNHSVDEEGEEEDENETRVEAIKASFGFGQAASAASLLDDEDEGHGNDSALGRSGASTRGTDATAGVFPFRTFTEPFQSGSVQDGGAVCLLAWTPVGEIETIRGANLGENLVKVEFADKSRRGFKFSDNYMFSMAALDDHGAFFGVPRRAREEWEDVDAAANASGVISSFVFYRPFESWANNSSWHLDLPEGEDAECVAAAAEFCAVATSLHCLRIYTTSGIEYALVRLPGRIVTMSAKESRLAVVYQDVFSTLAFQLLQVRVDSSAQRVKLLAKGRVPLSPPPADVFASHKENELAREDLRNWSTLVWLGFDDRLILYAVDSLGCVQALSESVGWNWFPIGCVGNALNKKPADRTRVFPLGIVNDSLLYFPLEKGSSAPKLRGKHRPVPLTFALRNASFPKTTGSSSGGKKGSDAATANVMWQNVRVFGLEEVAADGASDDSVVQEQAEMDKALILMMKTACANDEPARVLDLAKCLHLEKSHQIAQKLAIHFGLRQLQSELYQLYFRKFEEPQQQQQQQRDEFEYTRSERSTQSQSYQAPATAAPPQEPLRASLQSKALLSRRAAAPQEKESVVDVSHSDQETQEAEDPTPSSSAATPSSSSSFFSRAKGLSASASAAPTAKPVVERSVAPENPFMKRPAAQGKDKEEGLAAKLSKFSSPPPVKKRKSGLKK